MWWQLWNSFDESEYFNKQEDVIASKSACKKKYKKIVITSSAVVQSQLHNYISLYYITKQHIKWKMIKETESSHLSCI